MTYYYQFSRVGARTYLYRVLANLIDAMKDTYLTEMEKVGGNHLPYVTVEPAKVQPFKPAQPAKIVMQKPSVLT